MIKPTMFDAFVNTMKKSHIAKQSAKKAVAHAQQNAAKLEQTAHDILTKSGADAKVSCRVKSVDSTASKQIRYLKDFDTYENKRNDVLNIILCSGMREIIGDSYGMRFIYNAEKTKGKDTAKLIYDTMLDYAKNKKDFSVSVMENYFGNGIKPYADNSVMQNFAKLTYKNPRGQVCHTASVNAPKKSGYTRTNTNANIFGVNTEIQGGGKLTTLWGDVEHFLYDVRMGKKPDLSKLTDEQKIIAKSIINDYKALTANNKQHEVFNKEYLSKIWGSLRKSEIKGLDNPELPAFPQGFPDTLRAENIMKLAHV